MKLNKWMSGLMAALAFSACGPEVVGSRYVKQQTVKASEGAVFAVTADESAELNGTRLELPAGALSTDTHVTVELGLTSILGAELAAGPSAVFGPAGTSFTTDVALTLPVLGLNATDDVGIVGLGADGIAFEVDASQVALDATRTRARFRIRQLANYQPRRRAACMADSDCSMGLRCVNGHCRVPPSTPVDAGVVTGCPMSCPNGSACDPMRLVCVVQPTACTNTMNCPTNFSCVNGACVPPANNSCGMGTACASGQACLNGLCVPVPTDGGSTNPNACMADRDCNSMTERCVNGACRAQGVDAGVDAGVGVGVDSGVVSPAVDGGSPNPAMCRTSADCMGTTCVNGVCQ